MGNYQIGSFWRKWDLHIHGPDSVFNNQFEGKSPEDKWGKYITALEGLKDIAVLGITDYFSLRNYQKTKQFKDSGRLSNIDLLIPNVELRILPVTNTDEAINLHLLFSPEIVPQLEDKLFSSLTFEYQSQEYKCTETDLIRLGRKYKKNGSLPESVAYAVGVEQFKTTVNALRNILSKNSELRQSTIVVVTNSSSTGNSGIQHSSLAATRQDIYCFADMIFSGNPKDREHFLGLGVDRPEKIITKYLSLKPCIHGSDAHSLGKLAKPDLERYTWIKADTTFEGLRQLIIEPGERVYIGQMPEKLKIVQSNKTKYIKSLKIKKFDEDFDENWFDAELIFNPGLVAIIGSKGSGKSALADIVSLLGNTHNESFAFLNDQKFCRKGDNKARHFNATLEWESGDDLLRPLDFKVSQLEVEFVKYIPQQFLEKICNEPGKLEDGLFHTELKQVIFSHVETPDRLGQESLDKLLSLKTDETYLAIESLASSLKTCNEQIVDLEQKISISYTQTIEEKLKARQKELEIHEQNPLEVVEKPDNPDTLVKIATTSEKIESLNLEKAGLAQKTDELNKRKRLINQSIITIDKIISRLNTLVSQYGEFQTHCDEDLQGLGLKISDIITFKYSTKPLDDRKQKLEIEKQGIDKQLNSNDETSYPHKIKIIDDQILKLQGSLDEPHRKYQRYLEDLVAWNKKKIEIIGEEDIPNTISYYQKALKDIMEVFPLQLVARRQERKEISAKIYRENKKLAETFKELYGPVQKFIEQEPIAKTFDLRFEVSIIEEDLEEKLFGIVSQGVKGTFYGNEEGLRRLREYISSTDFNDEESTLAFIDHILKALQHDMRSNDPLPMDIASQLKKGFTVQDLYTLLFTLNYLKPIYLLRLGDKDLQQLSPGEKGALLLTFYLLVDRDDIPLIIDQPEENLDNETVYRLLVPAIQEAKKRRQVFIVTHNPNLAVVSDSEQVIHAQLNKKDANRITYTPGSIENPIINRKIVDVLEGTRPAFDNRDSKYQPT